VLVEPDGTTGSYILFDKTTLQPIAMVNQAGQQININTAHQPNQRAAPPDGRSSSRTCSRRNHRQFEHQADLALQRLGQSLQQGRSSSWRMARRPRRPSST